MLKVRQLADQGEGAGWEGSWEMTSGLAQKWAPVRALLLLCLYFLPSVQKEPCGGLYGKEGNLHHGGNAGFSNIVKILVSVPKREEKFGED